MQINKLFKILVFLRLLTIIFVVYGFFCNNFLMSFLVLIIFIFLVFPKKFTYNSIDSFPIAIEILLLICVFFGQILGEIFDFYYKFENFDKLVHFILPVLLGSISYLIVFTLVKSKKLTASNNIIFVFVIFFTLGVGALWEIFEYLVDLVKIKYNFSWVNMQGSSNFSKTSDTMIDLIADLLGGIFGALITIYYLSKENRKTKAIINDINKNLISPN